MFPSCEPTSSDTIADSYADLFTQTCTHIASINQNWLIVDVETTGLDDTDAITEIGAFHANHKNGMLLSSFHTMVNPGKPIPEVVTRLTGITHADCAEAPHQDEAIRSFVDWINALPAPPVFVAHSVRFDWGFLSRAARQAKVPWPSLPHLCTLESSRILVPKPTITSHRLINVAQYFDPAAVQEHRALTDCHLTLTVLNGLLEIARANSTNYSPPIPKHEKIKT